MKLLYRTSLGKTIDAVDEMLFMGRRISRTERLKVCKWIADRQGKDYSYARMFAPTSYDLEHGFRAFTGERITSAAALRHMIGEEACRVVLLLDVREKHVSDALKRARRGMQYRLKTSGHYQRTGMYCCGACTISLWRQSAVKGFKRSQYFLRLGMQTLRRHRAGDGSWHRFPFYYTLLALSDMPLSITKTEIRYALPRLERLIRQRSQTKFGKRRQILAERILSRL